MGSVALQMLLQYLYFQILIKPYHFDYQDLVELSNDLRELASSLSDQPTVPYKHLRWVWIGSNLVTRPDLMGLLSGSNFVFCSPKPREKSEELKARLRKLDEASEKKAYGELVKDITPTKSMDEPFS
uniref:Uncharacterized protein n=1 Tax=Solanum lycopersicum TaxID=4081 RepID=K4D1S5_SOLLC